MATMFQHHPATEFEQLIAIQRKLPRPATVRLRTWLADCVTVPVYRSPTQVGFWLLRPISQVLAAEMRAFEASSWDAHLTGKVYDSAILPYDAWPTMESFGFYRDVRPQGVQILTCSPLKSMRSEQLNEYDIDLSLKQATMAWS